MNDNEDCAFWRVRAAGANRRALYTERLWINDLGEAGYRLLRPIPAEIRKVGYRDFQAWFRQANIGMGGNDRLDALQGLRAQILDAFDDLSAERSLATSAALELQVLNTYIVKT